ncbi:amino acid adenylation domain-containing protein [Nonomuraea fuscirosea]|uniref:amino acid adenylation domain-containing protein n=1 Tax=Nonomuraea fuscirosea TaxID=1291556 RepID=UPI0037233BD4
MRSARLTGDRRKLLDQLLDRHHVAPADRRIAPSAADRARLPLSFAQRRLWFIHQLDPGSAQYNVAGLVRFDGALDVPALSRSVDEIVRRHETLRTTFHQDDGEPWARVEPADPVELPLVDLSCVPEAEREAAMAARCHAAAHQPFDLTHDLMVRTLLVRTAPREHALVLCVHHIAADGWSLGVMFRELTALYEAFRAGAESPLAELSLQYADFAIWQAGQLDGPRLRGQLDHWCELLAGSRPVELPGDVAPGTERSERGASVPFDVHSDLAGRLRAFGDGERATLYMVLLTAFAVLLHRWSGQDDLVIGASIAGRNRAEIADLVGPFTNTLPLRFDLSGEPSFREALRRVRQACLDGYANQDAPFERVVDEVNPDRDPAARTPLFGQTLVVYETPHPRLRLPDLDVEVAPLYTDTAKFDLRLEFTPDHAGALHGLVEYPVDRYDEAGVRRLAEAWRTIVTAAVAEPDRSIGRLPLMGRSERERQLRLDRAGTGLAAADGCLHRLFEDSVDRRPDAVAAVDDGARLTYRELDEWANRLAHLLRESGVRHEDTVGVCLPRSAEQLAVLLGVLKAGAAYVPLDPALPAARLAFMVRDSAPRVVVTRAGLPCGDAGRTILLDDLAPRAAGLSGARPGTRVDSRSAAYVIYTSGSTGRPKGVVNEHRALVNRIRAMREAYGPGPDEAVLYKTPIGFDVSVGEWALGLASGARVVIAAQGGHRDPAYLAGLVAAERVGTANFVPSLLGAFLEEPGVAECGSLRRVLCGGEVLPPDLARRFHERLPDTRLYNLYGPTEAAIDVTAHPVPLPPPATRIPIGRPVLGALLYVLDPHLEPVPDGVPGELYIGGAPVARGYHARPALTGERFGPDPFGTGGRLYRTGDRVRRLPDGTIDFLGRLDDQVKIRGHRVEPAEVEAVLAAHPKVDKAVVVARDGGGDVGLAAYVTMREEDLAAAPREERPETEAVGYAGETVRRVMGLRPSRVLQIGCADAALPLSLAPQCDSYHLIGGSDLPGIEDRLGGKVTTLPRRPADDFSGLPADHFDTVIIDSVIGGFPDLDHLVRVVAGAARLLRPGGQVFLGGLRSLPMREVAWTAELLRVMKPDTPCEIARQALVRRVAAEEGLALDPAFFPALVERIPELASAEVLARPLPAPVGAIFDVVLRTGPVREPAAVPGELDWGEGALDAAVGGPVVVRGVPDAAIMDEVRAARLLSDPGGPRTLAGLRRTRETERLGEALAELLDLGARLGRTVKLIPVAAGEFDVVLADAGTVVTMPAGGERQWESYATAPVRAAARKLLAPELRNYLRERLAEVMVPETVVVLPRWPVGPNGKLDRSALPPPDEHRQGEWTADGEPRTDTERAVAGLWRAVLSVRRVGVHDDFYDLGGHSLLAARIVARIRAAFGVDLPLGVLLSSPTVAGVAEYLDQARHAGQAVRPIDRAPRQRRETT